MQGGADGKRGKPRAQHAAGEAEQQALEERFSEDRTGSRAKRQANRIFAAAADGPDQ